MGGVNPLLGMNPAMMAGQLKSGRLSRSTDLDPSPDINEDEIKSWLFKTIGETKSEGSLHDLVRDGQLLCRYSDIPLPCGTDYREALLTVLEPDWSVS